MYRSQYFGYLAYPLFLFIFLAAPGLLGQSSTSTPPSAQQQSQPSSQQQPENPQQEQVRIAQEAQARIRARRRARVQKIVEDTYSHKYELYAGGGYMRFRPGHSLQQLNQAAWNVGFTDYVWPRLGITADLRGYYGNAYVGLNPYNVFRPAIDEYTFMAGPQYRFVSRIHWAVGGQALVGVTKGIFNGNSAQLPGTLVGLWPSATTFTVGVAAPVDYNLGPGLAFRIAPNYLFTTFGSSIQTKNLGFTSGLVVRFGRR